MPAIFASLSLSTYFSRSLIFYLHFFHIAHCSLPLLPFLDPMSLGVCAPATFCLYRFWGSRWDTGWIICAHLYSCIIIEERKAYQAHLVKYTRIAQHSAKWRLREIWTATATKKKLERERKRENGYRTVKLSFNLFTLLILVLFDAVGSLRKWQKDYTTISVRTEEMIWFGVFVLLLPRTHSIFKYEYAQVPSIHNLVQLYFSFVGSWHRTIVSRTTNYMQHSIWKIYVFGSGCVLPMHCKTHSIFGVSIDTF